MAGAGQGMPEGFFSFMPIMMLIFGILIIVPFWIIFSKVGHSKWLGLLMIIPVVNVIAIYYLAFSAWPSLAKGK